MTHTSYNADVARANRIARRRPRLTREQEERLFAEWRAGNTGARDRLIESQLRYVVAIALGYRNYGVPLGELIAEGNVGLMEGMARFDETRGHALVTYTSHWIRCHVVAYVLRQWSLVGGGKGGLTNRWFFMLRQEWRRILAQMGPGEAAMEELARRCGTSATLARRYLSQIETKPMTLDAPLPEDPRQTIGSSLTTKELDPEQALLEREAADTTLDMAAEALSALDARERFIIERRVMTEDDDRPTQGVVAEALGLSRERIRQLGKRAQKKMLARIGGREAA